MNTENKKDLEYRYLKAFRGSSPVFVNKMDNNAVENFRQQHENQDLLVSTWCSETPNISGPRKYSLHFHFIAGDIEKARRSALEAIYYINENFSIPDESIEVIYNGGGAVVINNTHATQHEPETPDHGGKGAIASPDSPVTVHMPVDISCADNRDSSHNSDQHTQSTGLKSNGNGDVENTASIAEITLIIQPVVFGARSTPFMPALNYHLARQMTDDGLSNIDVDRYIRDSYFSLSNSMRKATSRYVIPLIHKELLYLDGEHIAELSKKPRPDDSMAHPQYVPEAGEWFDEIHAEFEKKQRRQNDLRDLVQQQGWEIPPCIRKIQRLCLYDHIRLESYRVVAHLLSWIGASQYEIRFQIHNIDHRNPIKDYVKLKHIITFGIENPWFVGCKHPLLSQFCPAGGCFIRELQENYEQPYLFE